MAKQRGIHQISGKINNLCYYEQKYVRGGLIRRINEAMSGRLKIDPVFERTRNANRLFGAASLLAKSFLQMFDVYNDLLTYPSRQAKLTKGFLSYIREQVYSTDSTEININRMNYANFLSTTDLVMKNKLSKYFPTLKRYYSDLGLEERFSVIFSSGELEQYLRLSKSDFLHIIIRGPYDVGQMELNVDSEKYTQPIVGGREQLYYGIWESGLDDWEISLDSGTPLGYRAYYAVSIIPSSSDVYATGIRFFSLACAGFIVTQSTY